jgi:hypothetical protein
VKWDRESIQSKSFQIAYKFAFQGRKHYDLFESDYDQGGFIRLEEATKPLEESEKEPLPTPPT